MEKIEQEIEFVEVEEVEDLSVPLHCNNAFHPD